MPPDAISPDETIDLRSSADASSPPDMQPLSERFAAPGWANVRDGLVLVFMSNLGAVACVVLASVFYKVSPALVLLPAIIGMLAGLAALGGKWLCRSVPLDTGLRGPATAAVVALGYNWIGSVVIAFHSYLHLSTQAIQGIHVTQRLAEFFGLACFLYFLSGVAEHSRDKGLIYRAKRLLVLSVVVGFLWVPVRLANQGALVHSVRHVSPSAGLLIVLLAAAFVGGLFLWYCWYLALISSLTSKIDDARQA